MSTEERVKLYKAELEKGKSKRKYFNLLAFVFSSLYFLYERMYGHFLLFFALPYVLSWPLRIFFAADDSIVFSFIISHVIAGLAADFLCYRFKVKYVKLYEHVKSDAKAEYFAISVARLVICSILSNGLYSLYWGFKNWNIYKKATQDDINPYLRAWFFNWTAVELFPCIQRTTQNIKWPKVYGLICMANSLGQVTIAYLLNKNAVPDYLVLLCVFAMLVLMLIYPLGIVPVQKAINQYTKDTLHKALDKRFYPWEMIIFALGTVINYINWFGNPFAG